MNLKRRESESMYFNIGFKDDIIEVRINGTAQREGFKKLLSALIEHESCQPDSAFLVDLTELNSGRLAAGDIPQIAGFCIQLRDKFGRSKCAILAPRILDLGFSKLWHSYVQEHWEVEDKIFRTGEDALAWLK